MSAKVHALALSSSLSEGSRSALAMAFSYMASTVLAISSSCTWKGIFSRHYNPCNARLPSTMLMMPIYMPITFCAISCSCRLHHPAAGRADDKQAAGSLQIPGRMKVHASMHRAVTGRTKAHRGAHNLLQVNGALPQRLASWELLQGSAVH